MILLVALLGLVFGSFLEALTYRLPRGISISKGRSFCPKCKEMIHWYDNIPILSYIVLGGKCRNCREKIPVRAPLLEFFVGFTFVVTYIFLAGSNFVGGIILTYKTSLGFWVFPLFFLLIIFLVAIFVIDLENKIIPDELIYPPLFLVFVVLLLFLPNVLYVNLFCSFCVALFFLLIYFLTRGRGMGLGDVKLALLPSLFFGWPLSLIWLTISFTIGGILGMVLIITGHAKFGKEIPFAPFLVIGFLFTMFFSSKLISLFTF